MLSAYKFDKGSSGADIEKYCRGEIDANHREDYYSAEQKGQWHGGLAEKLGLQGEIKEGELARILDGYHPKTAEPLMGNAGSPGRCPGTDLTFSAPKSVSIEWALNPDPQVRELIEKAHNEAVKDALDYLSREAINNRDRHGEHAGQPVDGIAAATYLHGSSREGDMQLHSHAVAVNMFQRPDGSCGSHDIDLRYKMAAGALYRAGLADKLEKAGLATERDKDSFRFKNSNPEHEKHFSKRAEEINKAAGGKSYKEQRLIVKDSRKDKELTPAELKDRWQAEAKEIGYQPLACEIDQREREPMPLPEEFIKTAIGNQSTLTEMQLQSAVFVEAQGKLTPAEAQEYLRAVKSSAETVELIADKANARGTATTEARYTSQEVWQMEKRIGEQAKEMHADRTSIASQAVSKEAIDKALSAKPSMFKDQMAAFHHITGEGRFAGVSGVAGSGKTFMLDAARIAWEADGRTVYGCALAGKAAGGLKNDAEINSKTIHKTLDLMERGEIKLDARSVLVVDEAGMLGSRQWAELQNRVDEAGSKLVTVGEVQQLQPIDYGAPMGQLESRNPEMFVKMDEITRQKIYFKDENGNFIRDSKGEKILNVAETDKEREFVKDLRAGNAEKAVKHLEERGRLHVYNTKEEVARGMAKAVIRDMQQGKTSIAMNPRRAEVREINLAAREEARAAGFIKGADVTIKTELGDRQFAVGDRAIFLKNDNKLDVTNGTTGTVVEAKKDGRIVVQLDSTKKDKSGNDIPGKLVVVDEKKYNKIDNGWSFTGHRSQGCTVDRAHGRGSDRESHYVQGSRHREDYQVHLTKAERKELEQTMERSGQKSTSQDYARKGDERYPRDPPGKPEDAAKIEGLKAEAKDIEREMKEASKSGQSDKAAALAERLNAKNMEVSRATDPVRDKPQAAEPKEPAVRLAPKHADVKRDGELARKALESHDKGRRAPDGKALDAAIKAGKITEIRDSKGEKYYRDAKGNITADRLRDSRLQVRELNAGTRKTLLVDNRIGRVTVMGKEIIKGVKVGSKVIESKGREADGARKVRDMLGTRDKDAGIIKRGVDRVLTKHEKWKEAGFVRSTMARIEMSAKTKANEREAIEALEQKSADGKQIEKKEAEFTKNLKDEVKVREAREAAEKSAPASRDSGINKLDAVQQSNRQMSLDTRTPPPPPPPEIKIEPAKDVGRSLER